MKHIESRNNPTVKSACALSESKLRSAERKFFFEGVHLLEELLRAGRTPSALFVREDAYERYSSLVESAGCEIYTVTDSVYAKLSAEKAPQGIFAVSDFLDNVRTVGSDLPIESLPDEIAGNAILISDLQDNGNVGTVIRTAAALDCDVLLCGRCADVYSPKTVRATMGALFTHRVFVCPSAELTARALRAGGRRVIATALRNSSRVLGELEILPTDCFIIGNEGRGLTDSEVSACDLSVIIPMSGKTESLNAASAASVIMWECRRSRP